jgi:ParB-like chromosome segregation protein Spo0J
LKELPEKNIMQAKSKEGNMKIIEKKVKDLIPYPDNPRKNDPAVDMVAASIKEFGFKVPIVITSENVIIAGHTRLKAAKKLKLMSVPCIIADDLTEEQVRAYRIADNKVAELATWEFDLLGNELDALADFDMEQFGFEQEEEAIKLEEKELSPYSKAHYLITIDINDNDKIIELISKLKETGVCEIESTLN